MKYLTEHLLFFVFIWRQRGFEWHADKQLSSIMNDAVKQLHIDLSITKRYTIVWETIGSDLHTKKTIISNLLQQTFDTHLKVYRTS